MKKRILTEDEREFLTKPHFRRLWGRKYLVKPALVDEVFGDGQKIICFTPTMHRPNYYVVQIDSSWQLDNFVEGGNFCNHTDEVYDAIEEQFGRSVEHSDDCPDDCDGSGKCYVGFPGLNDEGSSWGEIVLSKNQSGKVIELAA